MRDIYRGLENTTNSRICGTLIHLRVRIPLKEEFEYRYAVFRAQSEDFLRWAKEHEEPRFAVATGAKLLAADEIHMSMSRVHR